MLYSMETGIKSPKDNSLDIGILEQNFTQLPTEGKFLFKEFLQNLVSMQETMIGFNKECTELSSN